ncbi:MAG: Na+/H+ antiporter subunit E [Actinomycetota bacterium]
MRRALKMRLAYVAALALTWVLFWSDFSVANLLTGIVVATALVVVFRLPPIPYGGRIRPVGLMKLTARFIHDVVVASAQVTWQVYKFGSHPRSAIIELNMRSDSDLYLAITAEMISLIPGTLAVELYRPSSTMLVHVLDVGDDIQASIDSIREQEDRVLAAFASDEELSRAYPFNSSMAGGGRP